MSKPAVKKTAPTPKRDESRNMPKMRSPVRAATILLGSRRMTRETGNAYRDAPLWHHWPTMIAGLRAKRDAQGPLRSAGQVVRATGMRVA